MLQVSKSSSPQVSKIWPSALNPQPSALKPQLSAVSPQPSALSSQHSALSPQPSALSPQPSALSSQHSALSPQPSALRPQPSALSPQGRRQWRSRQILTILADHTSRDSGSFWRTPSVDPTTKERRFEKVCDVYRECRQRNKRIDGGQSTSRGPRRLLLQLPAGPTPHLKRSVPQVIVAI